MTDAGVAFAADVPGKTGLYLSLSCYYQDAAPGTSVPVLDEIESFSVRAPGATTTSTSWRFIPALSGMTDASLSNWSSSVHEAFDSFPGDFLPLVIANRFQARCDQVCPTVRRVARYVLARGETLSPVSCGDGQVQSPEGCDDSNTAKATAARLSARSRSRLTRCAAMARSTSERTATTARIDDDGDGCADSCLINNSPDCSTELHRPLRSGKPTTSLEDRHRGSEGSRRRSVDDRSHRRLSGRGRLLVHGRRSRNDLAGCEPEPPQGQGGEPRQFEGAATVACTTSAS